METKDVWMKDQDMLREEVDAINEVLAEAAKVDSRWAKLIWYKKPEGKTCPAA